MMPEGFAAGDRVRLVFPYALGNGHTPIDGPCVIGTQGTVLDDDEQDGRPDELVVKWDDAGDHYVSRVCVIRENPPPVDLRDHAALERWLSDA